MMRVLVCGGRDFDNSAFIFAELDALHAKTPITMLIEGGARGADRQARAWAISRGVTVKTYAADWACLGKAAGAVRNQRMLDDGRPALVVAFPGGRGTADMVQRAAKAKVRVDARRLRALSN